MDPAKLKVVELRAQLSQRGLDAKGNKAVLVERLRTALEEENATQGQGQINPNAEIIHDSTVKENNEKSPEPTKLLQTPKSSGRSSRSSSMTTPTKVSTRSAPRTSTTPNSMKQSSPTKGQNTEVICETLPTISESVPQDEKDLAEEKNVSFLDKVEEREARDLSASMESKNSSLSPIKEDRSKKLDVTEKSDVDANVSQVSVIKSPKKSSEFVDRPLQEEKPNIEDLEPRVPVTKKEISMGEETIINTESNDPNIQNDSELKQNIKKTDEDEGSEKDIKDEDESIEPEDTDRCPETQNDVKSMDIPELKPSTDDLCDSEQAQNDDLNDEEETASNNGQAAKNESIEEEALPTEDKEVIKEGDDNANGEETLQEVEMADTKEEDTTEVAMKESVDKSDAKDRKRKRSPSPSEDRQTTPHLPPAENEPEIDDAALTLSWYDSDLNLVIDKDGFFTATPMYNDGFSDMWAGARASYGFLCGKVYYETKITGHCSTDTQNEEHPHVLRVGWSALHTSMQLGEEKLSYGYDSTEKRLTDNKYMDYGLQFGKDDVIGCYLDATSDDSIVLSYTVNGEDQGMAFNISKEELSGKPLFPHILSRNCSFACNFGQESPWGGKISEGYVSIGNVDSQYKVPGPRRPEKKDDCEVIMMCGLPACGKTTWAINQMAEHPEKMYNILGLSSLINKMKDSGFNYKEHCTAEWEVVIDKCNRVLNKLLEIAPSRRRNYILDQVNVYPSAPRRKMKNFCGYQRKAVVVVPTEEEFKLRASKHKPIEGKEIAESVLMEMKANFSAPVVGEFFDAVDWVELGKDEGMKLIEKYNKEGKEAGYGQQQAAKRPRTDSRFDGNRENRDARTNRDTRDNRDHRDRRGTYPERNRNPVWRGGGNMGWRDRPQRGGHARHGGGYGPPIPWRGRGAPIPSAHRGLDRRGGSGDRRSGNDRGRSTGSRQGGWAPMSNYQGSQVWNQQQNNWSGGQSQSNWGQQSGGWGTQQWGNWKGYGQGSYNQTNYNQQGYGNGNWNSWNQQYYNQYWGQQQPSGQTTAASGQAAGTTESTTAASSGDSTTGYGYAQEWQGYTQDYAPAQSVVTTGQRYRQHK